MYFLALASDYDGTLAHDSTVTDETLDAVRRIKESGRRFLLVTGRELPDLKRVFPRIDICDMVVAENGALLYIPQTEEERPIAPPPPAGFVERLEQKGVGPISVGHSIVATWHPHEATVLDAIHEMGLELEIIFNKGAVMVLPTGINKATGLAAALEAMGLSHHNVAGIGDAENDHAFLRACGLSVAVDNALPAVKDTADLVTARARGQGVEDLIERLLEDEGTLGPGPRHRIQFGTTTDGAPVEIGPRDVTLIAGSSGIGKSTLATAFTEKFAERGFQFVVFDPEGDYEDLENALTLGDAGSPPSKAELFEVLGKPGTNVVVNTLALKLEERPGFFADLQPELAALRAQTGRPHWLIIDEAHHLLPRARDSQSLALGQDMPATILVTVHPDAIAADALKFVDVCLALGPKADEVVRNLCEVTGEPAPSPLAALEGDQVLHWRRGQAPLAITADPPRQQHKRHTRKYAEGNLDEERSFYFRGPDDAMKLRAQNLNMFIQIGEGVDDDTWLHHLRAGDYSDWFRERIQDDDLAEEAEAVEGDESLDAKASRKAIFDAVRRRYTAPASERG